MTHQWLTAAAGVLHISVATSPAPAHHSIAGIYDNSQQVRFEAVVVDFQFVNPHPFVVVETVENGRPQQWRLEMDNRFELVAIGVTATTFKPGDKVMVTGSLARVQPHGLYVWRLDRPADGFWYEQVGSSPRIANTR